MKKFRLLLSFLMIGTFALTFVSCGDDEDDVPPTITVTADKTEAIVGEIVTLTISLAGDQELKGLTVTPDPYSPANVMDTTFASGKHTATVAYTYVIPESATVGTSHSFACEVTDDKDLTKSASASVTIIAGTTDLSAATAVAFERCGSTDATGLSTYGLEWTTSFKSVFARIRPLTGAKLVVLTSGEWTSIVTKEDLATAVDAATGITEFAEVNAGVATASMDHVIATKTAAGDYYIINLTSCDFTAQGCTANGGNLVIINGNAKN